jgi:serine/threonine-protein phosphatase 2A regulatory subunit B''
MELLDHDVVPFADVLCQMSDMIQPAVIGQIRLSDLLRPDIIHVAGTIFDALFNLGKFIQFEQRDPFSERQKRDDPFECDWDRFAYDE